MTKRNNVFPGNEIRTEDKEIEIKPDLAKLRVYTQAKLILAGQLRIIRESLQTLGRENGEKQLGELIVKLAEDRFTLAVLGQFKRGKSSLMNAIIGRELLPTGVLPLTSAITILKYGPTERLIVSRNDVAFSQEFPVSTLSEYVTEKYNPDNRKKIKSVSVELPVPFLRYGIEFVDTPGVGSAITANTATTYSFLPECDAVLFVTGVDTPLTSLEIDFLKEISGYVNRIFFVINKIDLVTATEQGEVLQFVTETIKAQMGHDVLKVFPVSSRLGLEARMSGNATLYDQSGLKALEDALGAFLSEEKSAAFLATVIQKTIRILDTEAAQDAFGEAVIQSRLKIRKEEKVVTIHQDPNTAVSAIIKARKKLESLSENIAHGQIENWGGPKMPSPIPNKKDADKLISDDQVSIVKPEDISLKDMDGDLHTRSCPVCRHLVKQAMDFFSSWQYQLATNEAAQEEFAAELGFCPLHTWQMLSISSPYGTSVGYARFSELIVHRMKQDNNVLEKIKLMSKLVHDSKYCRVCELLRKAEEEYISLFLGLINETDGRNLYRNSQGACLQHLGMLMEGSSPEIREFLFSHSAERFEQDAEDMRSYAMKYEALRRALHNKNEEDAYRRAIIRIVGDKSVCMPWGAEREI